MLKRQQHAVSALAYSDGGVVRRQIPRTHHIRKLRCRLVGTVVVSGGTGAGAAVTDGLNLLLSSLKLESKPSGYRGSPVNVPILMWYFNTFATRPNGRIPVWTDVSDDAAATYSPVAEFDIPLAAVGSAQEDASMVKGPDLTQLDLVAQWSSDESVLFSGSTDYTSATAAGTELRVAFIGDEDESAKRDFSCRYDYQRVSLTATGKQTTILPSQKGEGLVRVVLCAVNAGARDDSVIASGGAIKLHVGSRTIIDEDAEELRQQNADDLGCAASDIPTGVYFLDNDQMGDGAAVPFKAQEGVEFKVEWTVADSPSGSAYVDMLSLFIKKAATSTE